MFKGPTCQLLDISLNIFLPRPKVDSYVYGKVHSILVPHGSLPRSALSLQLPSLLQFTSIQPNIWYHDSNYELSTFTWILDLDVPHSSQDILFHKCWANLIRKMHICILYRRTSSDHSKEQLKIHNCFQDLDFFFIHLSKFCYLFIVFWE